MISLAQFVDRSAESLTVGELQPLYQIADADGDSLAIELILAELEKRNDKM